MARAPTPRRPLPRAPVAARASARRAPGRVSPLAWLLVGFLLGVAASYWVSLRVYPADEPRVARAQRAGAESPGAEAAPRRPAPKPLKFEFYDLLPAGSRAATAALGDAPAPLSAAPAPPSSAGTLWLQVGAFRSGADAERQRAEVALLGLSATVETEKRGSAMLYRVLAGPYDSGDNAMSAHRRALTAHGMDSLVRTR